MSLVLDGKALSKSLELDITKRVACLKRVPKLATVLVGVDPASMTYVKMKVNTCKRLGLESISLELAATLSTAEVIEAINKLNDDLSVDGILLQHPLPSHINTRACFDAIDVDKDVDGVTSTSFGKMTMGDEAFVACTPLGIMRLLHKHDVPLNGKNALVIGRSPILGKPMAMQLLNENCTVQIAHSHTTNLEKLVSNSQIIIAAVGRPRMIKDTWISEGSIVVDAGYHPAQKCGDVQISENLIQKVSAYTPVPGGVGPMTINTLIEQTVTSCEKRQ